MKKRLVTLALSLVLALQLFSCSSDGAQKTPAAAKSGQSGNGHSGGAGSGDPLSAENTLPAGIMPLSDRDTADAEYISGIRTYTVSEFDTLSVRAASPMYTDGGSLWLVRGTALEQYDAAGTLTASYSLAAVPEGTVYHARLLPDGSLFTVSVKISTVSASRISADGTELLSTVVLQDNGTYSVQYTSHATQTEDGGMTVVLLTGNDVFVFDENLEISRTIGLSAYCSRMIYKDENTFLLGSYSAGMYECNTALGTCRPAGKISLPSGMTSADLHSDGSGVLYYSDKNGIYKKSGTVLEWTDGAAAQPDTFYILDENTVYAVYHENTKDRIVRICTEEDTDDATERRVITLGYMTVAQQDFLQEAVAGFNASTEDYYIRLVDYSQKYGNFDKAAVGFREEVFAEKTPDILMYTVYFDMTDYYDKGVFLDLDPYFGETLLPGVREAYSTDGQMFHMPLYFEVNTLTALKSTVDGSLTFDRFYELGNGLLGKGTETDKAAGSSGIQIIDGQIVIVESTGTPQTGTAFDGEVLTGDHEVIDRILDNAMYDFLDYENKDCSFDSEEFREFVTYLKRIDADYVHENAGSFYKTGLSDSGYAIDTPYLPENIAAGRIKLLSTDISSVSAYAMLKQLYGGEAFSLCGYPTDDGYSACISCVNSLSVLADSDVLGGCGLFLQYLLSDECQSSDSLADDYLPVTLSAMEILLEKQKYFYFWRNSDDMLGLIDISAEPLDEYKTDFNYVMYNEVVLTDEDRAAFLDFFANCHMKAGTDSVISQIAEEELSAWESGAKTLEEVTSLMQSRIWIYLNE